ncbi:succinylglutamate desuccinylase/aspartoacylase family protein [Sinorhizobium meliloti]|uniref:succinylglutamate desuccinylase/aspartoacylase family protein n=1 Tax=Rhizobium meliloti TaxID=382 RepID=UPI00067E69D5|nr:succinylglutamate desuccinylase/aspartoacylase family protein [Sinorhizobium meliloti]MDX0110342.1 succinylglutamate desuccinylase [Sinorhizobium meliloti]UFX13098.1 succinylglutamate desuccinylase/aspartoacylase family protein [Sinorhizobium meliloti]
MSTFETHSNPAVVPPARKPGWTSIDFEAPGIQSDFARVPYSSDSSAYGWIPVPMICFNSGRGGPTALLTAGTHGDEYEGQIALRKLVCELKNCELRGRVIILPALNQPAVKAGRRNSPLDGGNLNRLFPGSLHGGPTAVIAHFVANELFPLADVVIDLHSGGTSLDYTPMALAYPGRDASEEESIRRLLKSFAAPYSATTGGSGGGNGTTLYAAAEQQGIPAITTELGGGPTLSKIGLAIAETGLRRVLRDYEIANLGNVFESPHTSFMRFLDRDGDIYAPRDGLFEPFVKAGDKVTIGQKAGKIHRLDDALTPPVELTFEGSGIVAFTRFPTLTATGDALFGLMIEQKDHNP